MPLLHLSTFILVVHQQGQHITGASSSSYQVLFSRLTSMAFKMLRRLNSASLTPHPHPTFFIFSLPNLVQGSVFGASHPMK